MSPAPYVVPRLDGTVALITGSNAGLGLETALYLADNGARVLMACRNQVKAETAAERVRAVATAPVEVVPLDLSSLDSVADCAAAIRRREPALHLLINNAGLMGIDEARTEDGFEMQLGVNHLGHFALTAHLAPLVLATPRSRIVTMTSMGHRLGRLHLEDLMFERRRYDRWRPYLQSKLANLLFTAELDRRLRESGAETLALSAHPGASRTDLGHEGHGALNKLLIAISANLQPVAIGALPLVRAATDPDARSGQLYGPRWIVQGRPVVETPSRRARRADDARALWQRSEDLTGVPFPLPKAPEPDVS